MPESDAEPIHDPEERAAKALEEHGGLPEDNPFTEVVRELRDDGQSWEDVLWTLDECYNAVDAAASEEAYEVVPKWRVAAVVDDPQATSGKRYEYYDRIGETQADAEALIRDGKGLRVDSEETEQIGYAKVG